MSVRWHAYIDHQESVHTAEIMADTAALAAVAAARATGIAGTWTVIQGAPVKITVEERRDYAAVLPDLAVAG